MPAMVGGDGVRQNFTSLTTSTVRTVAAAIPGSYPTEELPDSSEETATNTGIYPKLETSAPVHAPAASPFHTALNITWKYFGWRTAATPDTPGTSDASSTSVVSVADSLSGLSIANSHDTFRASSAPASLLTTTEQSSFTGVTVGAQHPSSSQKRVNTLYTSQANTFPLPSTPAHSILSPSSQCDTSSPSYKRIKDGRPNSPVSTPALNSRASSSTAFRSTTTSPTPSSEGRAPAFVPPTKSPLWTPIWERQSDGPFTLNVLPTKGNTWDPYSPSPSSIPQNVAGKTRAFIPQARSPLAPPNSGRQLDNPAILSVMPAKGDTCDPSSPSPSFSSTCGSTTFPSPKPIAPRSSAPKLQSTLSLPVSERPFTRPSTAFPSCSPSSPSPAHQDPQTCLNGQSGLLVNVNLKSYQIHDLGLLRQREHGQWILNNKSYNDVGLLLAYDMGMGKTLMGIAHICATLGLSTIGDGCIGTTLVVAPDKGILAHWIKEIKRYAPNLKTFFYHSEGDGTKLAIDQLGYYDVILCTYAQLNKQHEILNWYVAREKAQAEKEGRPPKPFVSGERYPMYSVRFKRVILDEAHKIRNPTAQSCWALQKAHGLCLTGTPAQNGLEDVYPIMRFLGLTHAGLDDSDMFNQCITRPMNGQLSAYATKSQAIKLLKKMATAFIVCRRKEDFLALPSREVHVVKIHMHPVARRIYKFVKGMEFTSEFAKQIRLRQVCDHPYMLVEEFKMLDCKTGSSTQMFSEYERNEGEAELDRSEMSIKELREPPLELPHELIDCEDVIHPDYLSAKVGTTVELVLDIQRRYPGQKVIVFTDFLLTLKSVKRNLEERSAANERPLGISVYEGKLDTAERDRALARVAEDPNYTVLLMSIMAGGTGLNIVSCNHVILVEPWWNPYLEEQAMARVHRIGQTRPVHIYKLVSVNTIEEDIVKTQERKRQNVESFLNLCREREDIRLY